MYLGNTYEEKKASMDELCRRARKLGKLFGVVGVIYLLWMIGIVFGMVDGLETDITTKICFIFYGIIAPFAFYACGYVWYFGFITVKSWFIKYNVSVAEMAGAAGTTLAVSYILGGRKAAKTSLVLMLIIVSITLTIGWWVGLYNYISMKKRLKLQEQ